MRSVSGCSERRRLGAAASASASRSATTATTIAAPATSVDHGSCSPTNAQPRRRRRPGSRRRRSRRVVAAFFSSQAYAVNATSEPNTMRYANATSGLRSRRSRGCREPSPIASPATPSNTPRASICIAAESSGLLGQRRHAGVHRARGPGRRRGDEQRTAAPARRCRRPDRRAGRRRRGRSTSPATAPAEPDPEERAVEQRDEERDARDDQRGEPGGDPLLGPGDPALADEQQRAPTIAAASHCAPGRARPRAARCEDVEQRARDQEADGRHQERRQRPVGDGDREVGRAPDEVDGHQCESHRLRRSACEGGRHSRSRASGGRRDAGYRRRSATPAVRSRR